MSPPRLLLIDGTGQLYRAFHALPPLTAPDGTPTHAVLGFSTMLLKVLREERPDYVAVAFDPPGETERQAAFAPYKAQRPPMPPELAVQLPAVHRVLDALRVRRLAVDRVEADDLIGSLARRAAEAGLEVVIQSGDKDLLQLVGPRIWVSDPARGAPVGEAEVRSRYGVGPASLPDLLALTGDAVDNIPGVPGVGRKTAAALVRQFGDVDAVLAGVEAVSRPALRDNLRRHADRIRLNRSLVAIRTDLPVGPMDDLRRRDPDWPALRALFAELGFWGLLRRLPALGPTLAGAEGPSAP